MARRLSCAVVALLLLSCATTWAQEIPQRPPIPLTATQEARYMALLPGLRCMQCQNESLAASQAPLAADMRYKVRGLIAAGDSDEQVKQYLVDRYGQYVLYEPRFEPLTWLLWLGPSLLLLIAFGVVWRILRARHSRSGTPVVAAPDAEALHKLLDEEP